MFHLTLHRPTTVQVEAMTKPPAYVVYPEVAETREMPAVRETRPVPTQVPVPYPAPVDPVAAQWAHVRELAAANDAAGAVAEGREAAWHRRVMARVTALAQRVSAAVALHSHWEAHWQRTSAILNMRSAAAAGNAMDAAYAEGGTTQLVGLVEQVRAMMSAQITGSVVAA